MSSPSYFWLSAPPMVRNLLSSRLGSSMIFLVSREAWNYASPAGLFESGISGRSAATARLISFNSCATIRACAIFEPTEAQSMDSL